MPAADKKPKTLYDKVFDAHIVNEQEDGTILLYIGMLFTLLGVKDAVANVLPDRHLVHEVTSPVSVAPRLPPPATANLTDDHLASL